MTHPGTAKLKKIQQRITRIPTLGPAHPLFGCNSCNMGKLEKQAHIKMGTPEKQVPTAKDFTWTMVSLEAPSTCKDRSSKSMAT
jgi:hypothetical protein